MTVKMPQAVLSLPPGTPTAQRAEQPSVLTGAVRGLAAGALTGGGMAALVRPHEAVAYGGVGLVAGGIGGAAAGAATTAFGRGAGFGVALGVPVLGIAASTRMGGAGMPILLAMLLSAPFAAGGIAGSFVAPRQDA